MTDKLIVPGTPEFERAISEVQGLLGAAMPSAESTLIMSTRVFSLVNPLGAFRLLEQKYGRRRAKKKIARWRREERKTKRRFAGRADRWS